MLIRFNAAVAKGRDEREKGFTLIELLVVVIIIGILAAIAIPVFLNQREAAWRSSVESDVKNAATLIETYGTLNNGTFADLDTGTAIASGTLLEAADSNSGNYQLTDGNTIDVALVGTTGYIITGHNENFTETISYNSTTGGLGDW